MAKSILEKAQYWWAGTDFYTMEHLTGLRVSDYDEEDGYQEFVDACEQWWRSLPDEEKIEYYKEHNPYETEI